MIILTKAPLEKRKKIYKWLYFSDFSAFLNELQGFSNESIPSYLEFKKDYGNFFFGDSEPLNGRGYMIIQKNQGLEEEIGFISYTAFHLNTGMVEIYIWLKSLKYAGKGHGTSAINILSDILFSAGFNTLVMRPSKKNIRAIVSYKKAGFVEEKLDPPRYYKKEFIDKYSEGDYGLGQDLFMVLHKHRKL
jgi:RimJ/RimL family protein N-acetyltransferase